MQENPVTVESSVKLIDRAKKDMNFYEKKKTSFRRPRRIMENREKIVTAIRARIKKAESLDNDEDLILAYLVANDELVKENDSDYSLLGSLIATTISDVMQGKVICRGYDRSNLPFVRSLIDQETNQLSEHINKIEMELSSKLSRQKMEKEKAEARLRAKIEEMRVEMEPKTVADAIALINTIEAAESKKGGCCGSTASSTPTMKNKDNSVNSELAEPEEHVFKVTIMGDMKVGKTTLLKRIVKGAFPEEEYKGTIGVDFYLKEVRQEKKLYRLQWWDIAGQERYGNMLRVYFKESSLAIIAYDLTNVGAFEAVPKWADCVRKGTDAPIILVGTKIDLIQDREESYSKGCELRDKINAVAYLECSAKTGEGVDKLLHFVVSAYSALLQDRDLFREESLPALRDRISSLLADSKYVFAPPGEKHISRFEQDNSSKDISSNQSSAKREENTSKLKENAPSSSGSSFTTTSIRSPLSQLNIHQASRGGNFSASTSTSHASKQGASNQEAGQYEVIEPSSTSARNFP